ncbi:MAG: class II aldolase/adducin family protein [Treponema sp.]|jgi:L-fuculose-phosphate aldolase|nr:class II aldolase/adducin family protein [Treponema sp.]
MNYPNDLEAKALILDIGRRMYDKNFVAANDGNITCKTAPDRIWATPTGVSKGFMKAEELVKMDLSGKVIQQGKLNPSSEIKMHLRIYNENPAVMGVCHAHPPVATSFAIAGISLDKAIYPEALVNLGTVPVVHYEVPGSQGIPDSVAPYCRDYNALLLANHGALAWGAGVMEAWYRLEALEHYAMILMYTGNIIGKANVLSCEQVRELIGIREKLGIRTGGIPPCCAPAATNLSDVGGFPQATGRVAGQAAAGTAPAAKNAGNVTASDIEAIVRKVVESFLGK